MNDTLTLSMTATDCGPDAVVTSPLDAPAPSFEPPSFDDLPPVAPPDFESEPPPVPPLPPPPNPFAAGKPPFSGFADAVSQMSAASDAGSSSLANPPRPTSTPPANPFASPKPASSIPSFTLPQQIPYTPEDKIYAIERTPGVWEIPGNDATYNIKGWFGRSGFRWDRVEQVWRFRGELPAIIRAKADKVIPYPKPGETAPEPDTAPVEIIETPKPEQPAQQEQPKPALTIVTHDDRLPGWFVKPSWWKYFIVYANYRPAVALVGPAGNGKTTAAEMAFKALDMDYYILSCTDRTEVVDLVGGTVLTAEGEQWRDGLVTRAFKEGKGIILDECDALDPRVMMALQTATLDPGPDNTARFVTANGEKVYPTGKCPLIATFNTFGTGANRQYVGRNKLDGASLDRWTMLSTAYENEIEMLTGRGTARALAQKIVRWANSTRKKIDDAGAPLILSPRTLFRIAECVEKFGWDFEMACDLEFTGRVDPAYREHVA